MTAENFRATNQRRSYRRNTTKLASYLTLFALLGLVGMLMLPALPRISPAQEGAGARTVPGPPSLLTANSSQPPRTTAEAHETYGQMPLSFEANRGQADESVNFVARGAGYTLALSPTAAIFALRNSGFGMRNPKSVDSENLQSEIRTQQSKVLRMILAGANPAATVAGQNELEGRVNYFIGNDPAKWRTDVPTFGRVRYTGVYPGIDVVYYGNQKRLEYDFVVAPGKDARAIALEFAGAEKVEVDAETGDLLVRFGAETIRQLAPVTYQETADGARREVESRYELRDDGLVGFEVRAYDASAPLVIDPVLQYSTYLGGSNDDGGRGIAVDSAGNAYVTGSTNSANFPTANAIQGTIIPSNGDVAGDYDVFVTKINAAGTALVYSTYLGGNTGDGGLDIAVDSAGNAYISGQTRSANFPTLNPIDGTYGGANDVFATKINAAGSALVYSTYLGGTGDDFGYGIALDSVGNAYLTGSTTVNFPTVNAFDSTANGLSEAFITKINAAGSALVYSTYLGGTDNDSGSSIAVDSVGNAYVTGYANVNFPTFNPIQATCNSCTGGIFGIGDAFVTKLNAAGTTLGYSTFLGGSSNDEGKGIVVDAAGNAYLTGETESANFPTSNPIDGTYNGNQDAFVTKMNAAGTALVYSTFLGGNNVEVGDDIGLDSAGNAYVAGYTASTNFPTVNPIQVHGGAFDVFVTKLNAAGSALIYSTYLGGGGSDFVSAIAVDPAGNAYVTGETPAACLPFPTTTGAFDTTYNGGDDDAFITKISETAPPSTLTGTTSAVKFAQSTYTISEDVSFVTVTITRSGDTASVVTVDFATSDGTASERSDYTTGLGTLRFAAGETSKTVDLLINEDSLVEGTETLTVALSNASAGTCIGTPSTALVGIFDDASEPATNVIDDSMIFAGTHYHDFLNRQADSAGLPFWVSQIDSCASDAQCREVKRINVSTAFFLSIEFQQTGYLVFRIYKETFTDSVARPRGMPRYREFLRDTQEIGRGVVVGVGNWETQLETNKQDFAQRWVQKAEFITEFPLTMTAAQYVDKLFLNAETTPTTAERNAAIAAFGAGDVAGRAAALRSVGDSGSVYNRQFNAAFVLMQYIGYLRRNPNDAPEVGLNYAGFDFWLGKMNQFTLPGEDARNETVALSRVQRAEMVKAFITAGEYRGRFGP